MVVALASMPAPPHPTMQQNMPPSLGLGRGGGGGRRGDGNGWIFCLYVSIQSGDFNS